MHFPDLEPCRYRAPFHADQWRTPLLAIGWLEHSHTFSRGFAPHGLYSLLERFIEDAEPHFEQYHSRGLHLCSLCESHTSEPKLIPFGFFNLLVPGVDVIYAAPAAILHYVKTHYYAPPAAFVEAVKQCPRYGSDEYMSALTRANAGVAPPIERYEDVVRAFREALEATAIAREIAASAAQAPNSDQGELLSDVRKAQRLEDATPLVSDREELRGSGSR